MEVPINGGLLTVLRVIYKDTKTGEEFVGVKEMNIEDGVAFKEKYYLGYQISCELYGKVRDLIIANISFFEVDLGIHAPHHRIGSADLKYFNWDELKVIK